MTPLSPGATIGILGGGQLGRLLALEAARLGFDVHIYCPEVDAPAARVAAQHTEASYSDNDALQHFASVCDVITYEFENVPVDAVRTLEAAGTPVRPGAMSLEISQDRLVEKNFLNEIGVPTVDYVTLQDGDELSAALSRFGGAGIVKTRREGYDGKGQVFIRPDSAAELIDSAIDLANSAPCILEAFAPFEREISVIVGRGNSGTLMFEPAENDHDSGILRRSTAPAQISDEVRMAAYEAGQKLAESLKHIGVLGLEFFVMPDGSLLANEFAPRVHNSGHWTPDACDTGQFEQHIRAVIGWPLGPITRRFDVVMENILGPEIEGVPGDYSGNDRLVSYGKRGAAGRRKVAHVTRRIAPVNDA
ncbi:MAG: 5-(carboxyamino)imidazole ribonucleotide synthase [Pseudomonadota bacterium]